MNSHIVLLLGLILCFSPSTGGLDSEVKDGGYFENQPVSILAGLFSQSFGHKNNTDGEQPWLIFSLTHVLFVYIQVLIQGNNI